jgi:hypothetical protein
MIDAVGNDESNGIADVTRLVARENRIRRRGERFIRQVEQAR